MPVELAEDSRGMALLSVAETIVLEEGYAALTMDRLAVDAQCPKGTLYRRFTSRDDVLLALALRGIRLRLDLINRGLQWSGPSRERLVALIEGVMMFYRLYPGQSRLVHLAGGAIRDRASEACLAAVFEAEQETINRVQSVILDGLADGDVTLPEGSNLGEVTMAFCALVYGTSAIIDNGFVEKVIRVDDPLGRLWRAVHLMADTYGWRPMFRERDWSELLASVEASCFGEEMQLLKEAAARERPVL
jgi:AcrR family transcriptional regulator